MTRRHLQFQRAAVLPGRLRAQLRQAAAMIAVDAALDVICEQTTRAAVDARYGKYALAPRRPCRRLSY